MVREVVDKESGAILFKPDEDTERILQELESLHNIIFELEKRIYALEHK